MTESALQVVIACASFLAAFSLYRSQLYRRYPVLFSYMAYTAVCAVFPVIWDTRGRTYYRIWIYTQPMSWAIKILLVRELCRVVLERHPGLFTLGRWVMYIGTAVAIFLSFLSLLPHIDSTMPARSRILGYWVAADRGISLSLAIFLVLMLFAVSRYPVRLSRNAILNSVLFTVCFMCDSLGAILHTIFDLRLSKSVILALAGVDAACFVVWLLYLTPKGEQAHFDWIHFGPEYEARMLGRLDTLNRVLQRANKPL